MELLSKLSKLDLVKGLPITKFVKDKICDACQLSKQTKSSFKKKKVISTSRPLVHLKKKKKESHFYFILNLFLLIENSF